MVGKPGKQGGMGLLYFYFILFLFILFYFILFFGMFVAEEAAAKATADAAAAAADRLQFPVVVEPTAVTLRIPK
jgi:Na+-transporting methylmalonyl-CoA/oxaloacetate decarboxylase gamma subunit